MSRALTRRSLVSITVSAVAAGVLGAACTDADSDVSARRADPLAVSDSYSAAALPPLDSTFDYQLGGAYPPPANATVVVRDRTNPPARLGYDICYVNGFQTQPAQSANFATQHHDLVLHAEGKPLVDPGWPDEYLFDTSTEAKRAAIAALVEPWIVGCKSDGYDAAEIDNLDSYTRSLGAMTAQNNFSLAQMYADIAHRSGLAIAQKNAPEQSERLRHAGFDFAVTESCLHFDECQNYTDHYRVVLDIEYTDELGGDLFLNACSAADRAPLTIMRDHDLGQSGDPDYFYGSCTS